MTDIVSPRPSYDLLTLGETLLRLSPPGLQRLDQARLFEIGIGGRRLNVRCLPARPRPPAALAAPAGKPVSYGLNYRATLTPAAEARAMLDTVAPHLELFVVAERDARAVLGFTEAAERLAEAIAARYGVPLVALTRPPGEEPGGLLLARGTVRHAPRYPVEIVDRIGAGDSFVGGLIHGLLEGDLDLGIRLAAYAAAVGLATPGDINYFGPEDLAAFHENTLGRLLR